MIYRGGLTDRIAYARVVILLHLCLLEQCLDPVFRSLIKARNFVTFYEFLIHLGVHHTQLLSLFSAQKKGGQAGVRNDVIVLQKCNSFCFS